jgi:hypothetical protein
MIFRELTFSLALFALAACGSPTSDMSEAKVLGEVTPKLGMTLGRGYDPTHPLEKKGDCIQFDESAVMESWKDARGIKGTFSETRVNSVAQLQKETSMSGSVAGESLWGGGSVSASRYEKFRSDESSFTWLVNFMVDVGEKTLDGRKVKLTKAAQDLVDANRLTDFYKMCGTEFVRSIQLGGKFTAVYEISAKETELVNKVAVAASASVNTGTWGASGSATFGSYVRDALAKSMLTKDIDQIGGASLDADVMPENLGTHLTKFQQQLNQGNARVIKIETASWETLGITGLNTFADWHRQETIAQLYSMYRGNLAKINRIDDYSYYNAEGKYLIDFVELENLNKKKQELLAQQNIIQKKATECINRNKCAADGINHVEVTFPELATVGIDDEFGPLSYKLPAQFAYYGRNEQYGGSYVRFYSIPTTPLPDSMRKLKSLAAVVFPSEGRKQAYGFLRGFTE